jgi:hypothetical protein
MLLTHDSCVRGILHLVLQDPLTLLLRRSRGSTNGCVCTDTSCGILVKSSSVQIAPPGMLPSSPAGISVAGHCAGNFDTPISIGFSITEDRGTPESGRTASSSVGSVDPTAVGRLKRKKQRLEQLERDRGDFKLECKLSGASSTDDRLSFPSDSSPSQTIVLVQNRQRLTCADKDDLFSVGSSPGSVRSRTIQNRLDPIIANVCKDLRFVFNDGSEKRTYHSIASHRCEFFFDESSCLISTFVPLIALAAIVAGKASSNEDSCLDDDIGQDDCNESHPGDYNPLLETNYLLGKIGAIPLLSLALSETLAAVTHQLEAARTSLLSDSNSYVQKCVGCVAALQFRVQKLVSLIDGASLLSPSNREHFCREGFTGEAGGFLVVGLLNVLRKLVSVPSFLFDGVWDEVALAVLKMLTSLSHENKTAAQELEAQLCPEVSGSAMKSSVGKDSFGLQVIADVLYHAVARLHDASDSKLLYDAIIFCLNILANVVESGCSRNVFVDMMILTVVKASSKSRTVRFLAWLTRWLVDETRTFRDAVVESTFGSSPCKHRERQLEENEDEKLVLAGNGFIFLCCLLVDNGNGVDTSVENDPTAIILKELPGDSFEAKLLYMKNTLKAFCNFYHYSVGDLSVAIVAPVKQLIQRLDSLQTNCINDIDA